MAALLTFTMGHTFLQLIGLLLPGGTDTDAYHTDIPGGAKKLHVTILLHSLA